MLVSFLEYKCMSLGSDFIEFCKFVYLVLRYGFGLKLRNCSSTMVLDSLRFVSISFGTEFPLK